MRQVTMLFVVPPRNTVRSLARLAKATTRTRTRTPLTSAPTEAQVRSFARSIQTKLRVPTLPQVTAQPAGDVLPETMSVGDAHRRYSSGSARMQVSIAIGFDESR